MSVTPCDHVGGYCGRGEAICHWCLRTDSYEAGRTDATNALRAAMAEHERMLLDAQAEAERRGIRVDYLRATMQNSAAALRQLNAIHGGHLTVAVMVADALEAACKR